MISFIEKEIQELLRTTCWKNTNHKEQNLQGRIYAHLLHLEKLGYIIEMETNIKNDKHVQQLVLEKHNFRKSEVDLLIYKKETEEVYAIELKWWHDKGFHYFDHYQEFCDDIVFAKELVEHSVVTEAAALTFVEPAVACKPNRGRDNYEACLAPFDFTSESPYFAIDLKTYNEINVPIEWHDCDKLSIEGQCKYYLKVFTK